MSNIKKYLVDKPITSYPDNLIKNMKMISFMKNKIATPFGSYIYRMQKYPGDVDLLEEYSSCCTPGDVVKQFEKRLKVIVKDIAKAKEHYFSEFKAGVDNRYDIDVGKLVNGVYHIPDNFQSTIIEMFKHSLLNQDEINKIMETLKDEYLYPSDKYDIIYNIIRERRVLRWNAAEILNGHKIANGKKKTLYEALFDKTHVKIDMIALYNNRFIEITNFIALSYITSGDIEATKIALEGSGYYGGDFAAINIDMKENNNIEVALPKEIEKLMLSNYYYSPFKACKRMFSLLRHRKDYGRLELIIPIVSGDVSLLYQIKSELDVILRIFEIRSNAPLRVIEKQLSDMKSRITYVLDLSNNNQNYLFDFIDVAANPTSKAKMKVDNIKKLKDALIKIINRYTIEYLDKIGFNPPPPMLLPDSLQYYYFGRKPDEDPHIK